MFEELKKMIEEKTNKRNELFSLVEKSEDVSELRSLNAQILALGDEIDKLNKAISEFEDIESRMSSNDDKNIETREVARASFGAKMKNIKQDIEGIEERTAFMNYVLKGEQRADQVSTTSDAGKLVPITVVNKIVENLRTYGNIFSRVTVTNVKGGIQIPTSSVKPVATWVSEGVVADKQKKVVDGFISFSYHKLQVRVAVTLEASVVGLSAFEETIAQNCAEAMIIAIEESIINGTGTGQPLGITKDSSIKASQKITFKPSDLKSYTSWSKAFAKLPLSKRQGTVLILNAETFEGDLMGMVDANGQPVARVNIGLNGEDRPIFKGKEVVEVESYLPSYDSCPINGVFGILINLKDYMFNSNLQMQLKRYFDEETDQWVTKDTLLADGKLSDSQGVLLLTKVAEG